MIVTREELYDLVWQIPTTHIAQSWGITEASVRKYCALMEVPKPPPGYWSQVYAGGKGCSKPTLKTLKNNKSKQHVTIRFFGNNKRQAPYSSSKACPETVFVTDYLDCKHLDIIKQTAKRIQLGEPIKTFGGLYLSTNTDEKLDELLSLLNASLIAAQKAGFNVNVKHSHHHRGNWFVKEDVNIGFRIRLAERLKPSSKGKRAVERFFTLELIRGPYDVRTVCSERGGTPLHARANRLIPCLDQDFERLKHRKTNYADPLQHPRYSTPTGTQKVHH